MKKHLFYSGVVVFFAIMCLSTGWRHYQIRPLPPVAAYLLPSFNLEDKGVEVHIKALSVQESKKWLGFDLQAKGIQPLYITVQNNSAYEYMMDPTSFGSDHLDYKDVIKKVKKSSIGRSIAFKALGFLFWPMMIPGTIDTFYTFHSNSALKKDYRAKSVKAEKVPVYSTLNRIVFIPLQELKEEWTVSLIEENRGIPWVATVPVEMDDIT